jgi:HAD superfamily hydrolase (TIGR01509 family)
VTPRTVAAVVFDMDGTLIDSESVYRAAVSHALAALGLAADEAFLHGLGGLAGPAVSAHIRACFGDDFPFEPFRTHYAARRDALMGGGIPLKRGAAEALRFLAGRALPLALATSSMRATALAHLGRLELLAHFQVLVAREDAARPKPAPDLYLAAAERLGVAAADCLAVEDSRTGVEAALAAGMMTVMVPDLAPPTPELRARCVAVHASLLELPDLFR